MRSTLVIGLFALVTFDQSLAQPQRVVQRTIVPYASGVEGNGFVSGSFVIRPARAGERSVGTLFPVSGGACHVADLNAIGIPAPSAAVCQQDSDCNSRLSRLHYSVAGWRSYCSAGTCLTRPGGQNERAILEVLVQRENLGSTAVGSGIAIPHGKLPKLPNLFGLFARLTRPIDFEALDNQPVDLIFLLLAPEAAGADHLKALARIARVLRDAAVAGYLRATEDPATLYSLLTNPASASNAAA